MASVPRHGPVAGTATHVHASILRMDPMLRPIARAPRRCLETTGQSSQIYYFDLLAGICLLIADRAFGRGKH